MKGFRKLGEQLFSLRLAQRLGIGDRHVAGGAGDTTAPTCTITCAQSSPSAATTLNFTITFSEVVTGFEVGDFVITNGTKGALGGSGAVYTCDVTPTGMSVVTANVAAGVAQDAAGNLNTVADQLSITSTAPFSDAFTRADGAIGSIWTGATWTIASNAVLNTPTLGAELLVNPGFEGTFDDESGGGGGTVNVAPGWNNSGCETDGTDTLNESATAHGGSKSQLITVNAASEGIVTSSGIMASIGWYQLFAWFNVTSGIGKFQDDSGGIANSVATTGSWIQAIATGRTIATNRNMYLRSTGGAANFLVDDASVKLITLNSLFATLPNVSVSNVIAQAVITVNPTTPTPAQVGLVINLDSTTSPANFVIAYLDGYGNAKLDKCVSGTYTNVISGAVTFGATKYLKVVKSGDNYSLYYGTTDVQVGTTQSIASMNGTVHGMFSTNSTPKLDTFQLSANP